MKVSLDWSRFKAEVSNRHLSPQFFDSGSVYYLYAKDGFLDFQSEVFKSDPVDLADFENNYKQLWNKQLSFADPTGITQVIPSARPANTTTFFTGTGDNGAELIFNLTDQDDSISKDLSFNEDIYIKDGTLFFENAPFGASFAAEAIHPQAGVVKRFCRKVFFLGTGQFQLNSEDKSLLPQGLILRVTVNNAPNKTAFKLVGSLEGFRNNTLL